MEHREASKKVAKELLLAELVYKAALARYRDEATELSRRVVAEAHRQYLAAQRDALVASWKPANEHLVTCPRCKEPTLALHWATDADAAPPLANGRRRPKRGVPQWAAPFAERGAAGVTRYTCARCGFCVDVLT